MQPKQYTNPFYVFLLVLPYGISGGFVTVTLPYLLTHRGFTVEQAATIVAIGFSANVWRFLWGPFADVTLTLKKWYWIGIITSIITLLSLCIMHYNVKEIGLLTAVAFVSQVAATFVVLPVGGLMAHRIEDHKKGSAGGWYQAGNMGGVGLGGGVGLWLATHYSLWIAGVGLSVLMVLCALIVLLIEDVRREKIQTIAHEIKFVGKELLGMVRVPVLLFFIFVLCMPIGTGAMSNLWSAVAADWHTDADTVALVTGILSALVSGVGCIAGGSIADRWGLWRTYFFAGATCALAPAIMAALPFTPVAYIYGVLFYSFTAGLLNGPFSGLALYLGGRKAASTKYSLLSSIANVPVVYMTSFDGWAHDHDGSRYMLGMEAAAGAVAVLLCVIVLKWMKGKGLAAKPVDA